MTQSPTPLSLSEQLEQASILLLVIVLGFPILFTLADWWAL
jgi:hypothetical protein